MRKVARTFEFHTLSTVAAVRQVPQLHSPHPMGAQHRQPLRAPSARTRRIQHVATSHIPRHATTRDTRETSRTTQTHQVQTRTRALPAQVLRTQRPLGTSSTAQLPLHRINRNDRAGAQNLRGSRRGEVSVATSPSRAACGSHLDTLHVRRTHAQAHRQCGRVCGRSACSCGSSRSWARWPARLRV